MTQPYPGPDNPQADAYLHALQNQDNVNKYLHALQDKAVKDYLTALHNQALAKAQATAKAAPPTPAPAKAAAPVVPQPHGTPDPLSGLPTDQRNAYVAVQSVLSQYGLESLAPQILNFVKKGYTGDSLTYVLEQTPEYKQRFSGNDARVKNGLAPLSPADYLAAERSYRSVLQSSGLPQDFYNSKEDFANLIGSDISPTELKTRADYAFQFANAAQSTHPEIAQALSDYYGASTSHLAAYFLDPTKSTAQLDRNARAAEIGGALKNAGINVDAQHAQAYADQGISYAQAQQGASAAGLIKQDTLDAAQRFNTPYDQQDLADAEVGGLASAQRKLRRLATSEAGLFAGNAGSPGAASVNSGGAY
jgi:ribosomal protein L12E/L44/L45/RPP1/RPP2